MLVRESLKEGMKKVHSMILKTTVFDGISLSFRRKLRLFSHFLNRKISIWNLWFSSF